MPDIGFATATSSVWSITLSLLPNDILKDILCYLGELDLVSGETKCVSLSGGRSNQVWRLSGTPARVLKVYRKNNDNPLFANDAKLEEQAMKSLSEFGLAPTFCRAGQVRQWNWILYQHVPGSSWASNVADVAHLLGRLHAQDPFQGLPAGPNGSDSLALQTARILDAREMSTRDWLRGLCPNGFVAPTRDLAIIHGDPVPGNFVVQDDKMTLIDWQCPSLGDPVEDLALFASPAMQFLYRGQPLSSEDSARFLAAYPDKKVVNRYRLLRPWFHWRMAAYCLWKSEQGNRDYEAGLELELDFLQNNSA